MGSNGNNSALLTLAPLLLPLALIAWMLWAGRKRQRMMVDFQSSLSVGDDVCTTSGLYGRIRSLGTTTVDLIVAPGTVLRFDRRAIAQVVPAQDAVSLGDDDTETADTSVDLHKDQEN